jgi:hypothetical protein
MAFFMLNRRTVLTIAGKTAEACTEEEKMKKESGATIAAP